MSRLENLILRFTVQRDVLNLATEMVRTRQKQGLVAELGLGSGRTYDHLREKLANFEVYSFDWAMEAHEGYEPPKHLFVQGEITKTFPVFAAKQPRSICFIHLDFGSPDRAHDQDVYRQVIPALESSLTANGVVASDRPVESARLKPVDISRFTQNWKYHLYEMA